jgi:eukaryotic-like serine/threonine-protein kinase
LIATNASAYRWTRLIGRGATAEVWEGVHLPTGRAVAAKHLSGVSEAARREVQHHASLDHPAIVRILDFLDPEDGPATLVMELGTRTLADPQPWSWTSLRQLTERLLAALGHAHARGVVHRDLKPQNVLWVDGAWKLADFGIAWNRTDGAYVAAGTPPYMSPEQFEASGLLLGPWTDLYALGCLLWELVTGGRLFGTHDAEGWRHAHAQSQPGVLRPVFPVPSGFDTWLGGLLRKHAANRWRRAADATDALAALGDASEPSQRPVHGSRDSELATALVSGPPQTTPTERPATRARSARPPAPFPSTPGRAVRATHTSALGLSLFGLRRPGLAGRHTHVDRLWSALQQVHASEDQARVVALRGPAGVGKSFLARWVCERAHELGAASWLRIQPGLGWAHALSPILGEGRSSDIRRARADFGGAPSRHDEELLSAALAERPGLSREASASTIWRFLRLWSAYRPVILWIDDVHELPDAATFVRANAPRGGRILYLLTTRQPLAPLPAAEEIDVGPLLPDEHRTLVRTLLGSSPLVDEVVSSTAGEPLLATQLVADWIDRGVLKPGDTGLRLAANSKAQMPASIQQFWKARLESVLPDPNDRAAVELAALLGLNFDPAEWHRALAERGMPVDGRLAGTLAARALVSPTGTRLEFVHGSLVEALQASAQEHGRGSAHHKAIATVLQTEGARSDRVGLHLWHAGEPASAFVAVESAMDGARATPHRGAELAALLMRIAETLERPDWTERALLWTARFQQRLEGRSLKLASRLRAEGEARGSLALAYMATRMTATTAVYAGSLHEGRAHCLQALAQAQQLGSSLERGRALVALGQVETLLGNNASALARYRQVVDTESDSGAPVLMARRLLAMETAAQGGWAEALEELKVLAAEADDSLEVQARVAIHNSLGHCALHLEEHELGLAHMAESVYLAEAAMLAEVANFRTNLARAAHALGDLERARALVRRSLEDAEPIVQPWVFATLLHFAADEGDLEAATEAVGLLDGCDQAPPWARSSLLETRPRLIENGWATLADRMDAISARLSR